MTHPRTLIEFMQLYPDEEDCRRAIFEHRWPDGFVCPRCGHGIAWFLRGRGLYECARCHYQGSLTAGTVLPA
jgi:Transposase zinc-ribbon domain